MATNHRPANFLQALVVCSITQLTLCSLNSPLRARTLENSKTEPLFRDTIASTRRIGEPVANKDKGGKNNKKAPTKDLKQKRQAKKEKKGAGARKSG
jgi:hypothetical protein